MKTIKDQAIIELNKLNFDEDDSGVAEELGSDLTRDFRSSEFFRSRPGEQDDDFPNFTGKKEVLKKAHSHFSSAVLDTYSIEADDQEKSWFTIYLRQK